MRNVLIALILLVGITLPLNAQPGVYFETEISQTSVWPGDRIHYRITLTAAQGVKLALEDFDVRNVNFEPFFLIERELTVVETEEETRYVFDFLLANYEVGDKQVEIPGLTFRYETSAPLQANAPSTQEMRIPPLPMSVRSTLNQPLDQAWIMESLLISQVPLRSWVPLLAGLAGLLVSSLPLGVWVWKKVPDWQARRHQLSRKKFLDQCSLSLNQLDRRLASNNVEIKDEYYTLEKWVGEYVQYFWDIQAEGLTHAELTAKLNQGQPLPRSSEALAGVFEHGQTCRYGPDNSADWKTTMRQDLQEMKKLCV